MAQDIAPGHLGNLTPDQEEKLRRLWHLVFNVCGIDAGASNPDTASNAGAATPLANRTNESVPDAKKPWKKRLTVFTRGAKGGKKEDASADPTTPASTTGTLASPTSPLPGSGSMSPMPVMSEDDKYGQTKQFLETLASETPESIRATIWSMVKHDHPDALLLRFLRARKWDVDKALVMLVSSMHWRHLDMKVDEDIMVNGEGRAVEQEKGGAGVDPAATKLAKDFLAQMRMGKSFVHGCDRKGRPICMTRVRLHRAGEQSEESLERYTVFMIETCRFMLKPPVDTATIIFDMTDFSLANMDNAPVKFMVKCFEANYPECLGVVLIHKAPWIFQGIWKIIRGWLDPVVSAKVHFTNNAKDLAEFIEQKHIIKALEGDEDWEFKFVEPVPGENDRMKDTETRDRLLAARDIDVKRFEELTARWLEAGNSGAPPETIAEIKAQRDEMAARFRTGYWELDPYVRARSLYDRVGILGPGGQVNFYPNEKDAAALSTPPDSAATPSASAAAAPPSSQGGPVADNELNEKVAAMKVEGASPGKPVAVADASADDVD